MNIYDTFKDIIVTPDNFKIDKDYLLKVHNNNQYNNVILNYYARYEKEGKNISRNKIKSISSCNKYFNIDRYDYNLVKDYKRTNLCKDKFCNNCKKVKQAARMSKYIPELEPYADKLYHLTLTIPNVNGSELKSTIKIMSKAFSRLMDYIKGKQLLSFYDFKKFGYLGSIRSLEITFNGDNYHPHYHCCFAFNNLDLNKTIKNKYSIDYYHKKEDKLFSEFEITVQKIWYLLINKMRVCEENFNILEDGYSCNCDKFQEGDYKQLFKYMTKETDENKNVLTYDNFKVLYDSTFGIKQIQGYGCFYNITDSDLDDEVDKMYCDIVNLLKEDEDPTSTFETPLELLNDDRYLLISRKKVFQYLKEL